MIIRVEINNKEYAVDAYENNAEGQVQLNDTFHLDEENVKIEKDTVFGTLDSQITIKISLEDIKDILKDDMVEDTVSILRSRGVGNTYDRSKAFDTAHDILSDLKYDIADEADNIMTRKYTTQDGLTIIDEELMQCPHKCGECIGTEEYGTGCMHGCHDCINCDGAQCLNGASDNYGRDAGEIAHDCDDWEGA